MVLLGIGEVPLGSVQFGADFLEGLLLLSLLDGIFGEGAVDFVLLGLELTLQLVHVIVQLIHAIMIGITIPVEFIGKRSHS